MWPESVTWTVIVRAVNWWGVARWRISQLHRFKLSLPFNSFLPHVTVINLVLYKPLTPHSTLLPDGVGSTSVVPVTTAISGSSADSVKYCCVCVWVRQGCGTLNSYVLRPKFENVTAAYFLLFEITVKISSLHLSISAQTHIYKARIHLLLGSRLSRWQNSYRACIGVYLDISR